MLMTTTSSPPSQNGKASTVKTTFSRRTSVSIDIQADPAIVWALLTNAADFARWNSTVISLEGEIRVGQQIRLKSVLDEKRIFKIKVREMQPNSRLVWGDSKGERVFSLSQINPDTLRFSMSEKIGGLMFPMYAKFIPPFDENFETFAADLKNEAEMIQNQKN